MSGLSGFNSIHDNLRRAVWPPLILMLLVTGVLIWQVSRLLSTSALVHRSDQVIAQAHDVRTSLAELESGLRGFLLTGRAEFKKGFDGADRTVNREIDEVRQEIGDREDQLEILGRLSDDLTAWRAWAQHARQRSAVTDPEQLDLEWERGTTLMARMRLEVRELIADESAVRDEHSDNARRAGALALFATVGCTLVAGAVLALHARRQVISITQSYETSQRLLRSETDTRRRYEERFRAAVDQVVDYAIFIVDPHGKIESWNQGVRHVLGYEPEEWIGKPLAITFPPELGAEAADSELQQAQARVCANNDIWQVKKDGTRFFASGITTGLYDPQGNLFGYIKVMRDQTGAKLHEEALRASEARFRRLFEASLIGTAIGEASGLILEANDAFLRMVGYSREVMDADQMSWVELTPEEYRILDAQALEQIRSTGTCTPYEKEFLRRDGKRVPVLLGASHLNSRGDTLIAWAVDLTEARRAEERFRLMADSAPVLVWLSDPKRNSIWFNKPWLTFTGRTLEQERASGWEERVHPEDLKRCNDRVAASFASREPFTLEYRMQRLDGEYRWMLDNGVPLYGPEGEFTGFIGSCIDISERKQFEDERDQLLESERAARAEAERANRMKDEFLSNLSHELRTPLNAILGWADLLSTGKLDEAELHQGIEVIHRNSRVQAQLIEDLLDMSRIISGKIRLEVERLDPAEVISQAIDVVRQAAVAKQIRIETCFEHGDDQAIGDPARLQQVIWNLLSNAIKFTGNGGRIGVSLTKDARQFTITVTDSGKGIRTDILPFVFDRFRQEDSSTTRRFGGMGLGLAIVKQLVDLHGGSVRADSAGENQGSTFTVRLPIAPRPEPAVGRPEGTVHCRKGLIADEASLQGIRVLIVDDEADARELVKRVLLECHATVIAAASAAEALAELDRAVPDVLVSDIGMPEHDGYELIRAVRNRDPQQGGNTPAVALTAFARSEDRLRAIRAGYQMHVPKPVEPAELVTVVSSLARHWPIKTGEPV